VTATADPLAGSYYVEALTDRIEAEAEEIIRTIDTLGGAVAAVEAGHVQREIQRAAYRFTRELEAGDRVVVGVNRYQTDDEPPPELLSVDRSVQDEQIRRLREVREGRSADEVRRRIDALRRAAEGDDNLMPPILDAVRAYAGVGEICGVLREVFGEYRERIVV
jgi:methylmalonyl-CoA mutase N-terminal domain/subunit